MSFLDHLLVILLALALPLNQYRAREQLRAMLHYRTNERVAFYRQVTVVQCAMLVVVLGAWLVGGRSPAALGFTLRFDGGFWAGLLAAAAGLGGLHVYYRRQMGDATRRASLRDVADRLAPFLPRTTAALPAFDRLAVTAGVCEEVLYRGFCLWYASRFFGTGAWGLTASVVATSAVFGLGHLYQGPRGIFTIFLTGLAQGAVYVVSGSLWIPMALHASIDLLAGRASLELHPEGDFAVEPD